MVDSCLMVFMLGKYSIEFFIHGYMEHIWDESTIQPSNHPLHHPLFQLRPPESRPASPASPAPVSKVGCCLKYRGFLGGSNTEGIGWDVPTIGFQGMLVSFLIFYLILPSLKLTFSHLKMDGWNTIVSFLDGLFSGANC